MQLQRRQLDQFRSTQWQRRKLPEALWQAAVEVAPIQMSDALSRNSPKVEGVAPLQANCLAHGRRQVVEVVRMAPDDVCEHDMLVLVRWQDRKVAVPLAQLTAVDPDESTGEAIGDWHYWVHRVTVSDLRTPAESSRRTGAPTTRCVPARRYVSATDFR